MRKILFSIAALFLLTSFSYAQSSGVQIGIGAETNFLLGSYSSAYNMGFGGNIKGLYGVGNSGQVTLTAGYSSFKSKSGTEFAGQTLSLLPVLAGYRYNLSSGLYAEPQAGLGSLTTKASGFSYTQTNLAAALNVGYAKNGFDVSVRYYTEGDVMSMFAIRLGYNFPLSK